MTSRSDDLSHFPHNRKCLWPGCDHYLRKGADAHVLYCFSHTEALGPELRERLRKTYGTPDWLQAVQACQDHARQTIEWRKRYVKGGSDADTHAPGR